MKALAGGTSILGVAIIEAAGKTHPTLVLAAGKIAPIAGQHNGVQTEADIGD